MNALIRVDDLEIELRRSDRRKTVDLTVDRAGELVIAVPAAFSDARVEEIIRSRLEWIYQTLGNKRRVLHPKVGKEYVTGEGFHYLGRKYRLKLLRAGDGALAGPSLQLKNGRFLMAEQAAPEGRQHFVRWYVQQATRRFAREVTALAPRVGVAPGPVRVMDLKNRWASCSKTGGLNFHWRAILLPIDRVRYLATHELVHLIEHSHSARFYEILGRVAPDYEDAERWLKENGDLYDL
jgi:hypothetical protein